jgi:hypothetical protein
MILATAKTRWQKIAMIIAKLMNNPEFQLSENSAEYIAERIYFLIQTKQLESQGNTKDWRHSEIRLPSK